MPTRMHDNNTNGVLSTEKDLLNSKKSQAAGQSASGLVKQYTLTEPDHGGQSYKSDEYQERTGEKLFVRPDKHDPSTLRSKEAAINRHGQFFDHRTIHEAEYERRYDKNMIGKWALKDISKGDVVRHTNKRKTMLLHSSNMSPNDARTFGEKGAVRELSHNPLKIGGNYRYEELPNVHNYKIAKDIHSLDTQPKAFRDDKLATLRRYAKEHEENLKAKPKLWYNKDAMQAELDPQREAEMEVLNKTLYKKGKSESKWSTSPPPSPKRHRSQSPTPKRHRMQSPTHAHA
jgi:hypothetical protein